MTVRDTLVVNAGSTSVKVSRRVDGQVTTGGTLDDALAGDRSPDLVVHRVVHGGERTAAEVIDDDALQQLHDLTELAPLHQPPALHAIQRCREAWPDAMQIACFDTAFHTTLAPDAYTYALPARLREKVRVYGFHGLSHAWSAAQVAAATDGARRVLVAHLGGGQSLCAVRDGRSVTTTMGFTPLDGLVMATRSGSVDPGAVLYLARHTDEDLAEVLEEHSGLLGLAGTGDMREVLARCDRGDTDAQLALDVWLHRFVLAAGGCVAELGGLDALVFTGGVGEGSARIRELVAHRLEWLGVRIAEPGTGEPQPRLEITAPGAAVRTFVVHAREDLQMLGEADALLG